MRRVLMMTLAGVAIAAASPAFADPAPTPTPSNDPCSFAFISGALACQGYYGNNLFTGTTGSATTSTELADITTLLTNAVSQNNPAYTSGQPYNLTDTTVLGAITNLNGSATLNFGSLNLTGLTILGAHFGNTPGSNAPDVSAFWLINLGSTVTNTITLSNGMGSSDAQIFATGGRVVPEPATWALMLLGFGGIGMAMRRSRRRSAGLMQIA
jgi:hypothetical protein